MAGKKAKSQRKSVRNKRGRSLTDEERMEIVLRRDRGERINAIAEHIGCSYSTCCKVYTDWRPANEDLVRECRARNLEKLASKLSLKAEDVLGHITPNMLVHDRVETFDEAGNLKAVTHSGVNVNGIAITTGILLDKAKTLSDKAESLRAIAAPKSEDSVESISALLSAIKDKASRLSVTVDLSGFEEDTKPPDMVTADYIVLDKE